MEKLHNKIYNLIKSEMFYKYGCGTCEYLTAEYGEICEECSKTTEPSKFEMEYELCGVVKSNINDFIVKLANDMYY